MNKLNSNFGYNKVTPNEKTKLVQKVFSEIAENYDLMNNLMSFGSHKLWKKKFIEYIAPKNNEIVIDIGSGTGDIAKNLLNKKFEGEIHLLDLNLEMLNISKLLFKKNKNVFFHQGDAENLKFKKNSFDKYIIAFCLRNITNIEISLKEALRVLKPGGIYCCLEFSTPTSILTSLLYHNYKSRVIPLIGKLITKNKEAYKYLSESIDLFPDQEKLKSMLEKNGFVNVSYINLFDGIVSIHRGYKI